MRDKILNYMAQGVKASQVASIVGCTPAYISQLSKDEGFLAELKAAREAAYKDVDEDKVLTNKYMALEHKLLDSMENAMAMAELPAITRALEVIATRQEKRAQRLAGPVQQPGNTVIVNLTLPSHAIPEYQINPQREVVSIGNRIISPMSSEGVKNLFTQIQQQRQLQAAEAKQAETEF